MESWSNVENKYDTYILWIEYSLLTNVQKMTSLHHGCTHIATNELTRVTLKKIVDEGDDQLLDFYQVNYFTCKIINIYQVILLLCIKQIIVATTVLLFIVYFFTQIAN